MVTEIRLYFEGDPVLRPALGQFLGQLRDAARRRKVRWHVIACGSRSRALEVFREALAIHPHAFNVLLVDSDSPVGHRPWEHLRRSVGGNWRPPSDDDACCHLMAQVMEAWFIADIPCLRGYYQRHFTESTLPQNANVEQIAKERVLSALHDATRNTRKGRYDKTKHAPDILQRLDASRVRAAAPHCDRLFKTLAGIIGS